MRNNDCRCKLTEKERESGEEVANWAPEWKEWTGHMNLFQFDLFVILEKKKVKNMASLWWKYICSDFKYLFMFDVWKNNFKFKFIYFNPVPGSIQFGELTKLKTEERKVLHRNFSLYHTTGKIATNKHVKAHGLCFNIRKKNLERKIKQKIKTIKNKKILVIYILFIYIQGVFFNWDPPISVPKRKPRISQSQLLFQ